ncbi:MAG TPA: ATP-binding protein [Noviherbaspirillum sp.]|nr:ATP-binding protein [Noviherbaspirillum sp.]
MKAFERTNAVQSHLSIGREAAELELQEDHVLVLFRTLQESLSNVARHAKATRVDVQLDTIVGMYTMRLCDNGVGYAGNSAKVNSFGIIGITERVRSLQGSVTVTRGKSGGTVVSVWIPLAKLPPQRERNAVNG